MDRFDRIVIGILGGLAAIVVAEALIGDRVGAGVSSISPEDGSSPAITTTIRIVFSQPMDRASVEDRLEISPAVDGRIVWSGNTMTFTPERPLGNKEGYVVTLKAGAKSTLGRVVNHDIRTAFTTRSPSVVYLAPSQGETHGLWMTAIDGGEPREILDPASGVDSFAVSPDGRRIAATINGEGQAADLWLLDPLTGERTQITHCAPNYCGNAAWAPDAQRLAFEKRQSNTASEGATSQIWLYDLPSGAESPLFADRNLPGYGPAWSPDGGRLAFFDVQVAAIVVVELSTGALVYLPSQMGAVGTFSPDGKQMVYEDFRAIGAQVFTELWIGSTTGEARVFELVEDAQEDQFPAWSPDGTWIAFGRRRIDRQGGFGSQLMLYDPESSELRQVTKDEYFNNTAFAWGPNGDLLLVQRFNLSAFPGGGELWLYSLPDDKLTLITSDGYGAEWLP